MKKSLTIGIGLALIALAIITLQPRAKAQAQNQARKHQVVIIWDFVNTRITGPSAWTYDGSVIVSSSSSAGAPTFPQWGNGIELTNLTQTADGIATLLDANFRDAGSYELPNVYGMSGRMFIKD